MTHRIRTLACLTFTCAGLLGLSACGSTDEAAKPSEKPTQNPTDLKRVEVGTEAIGGDGAATSGAIQKAQALQQSLSNDAEAARKAAAGEE